jgi:hypothetical protein
MSRLFKLLTVTILALFILACGLISGPISDIENAASTAEAFASSMPVETLEAFTTAIPLQTLEALPSAIPEIGNYFNPTGTPVDEWNGIPVMPQATVGEEFNESTYSYTVPATATEVQEFYNQKMEELGWTSLFNLAVTDEGGFLSFQKDDDVVTITITPDQTDSNSLDVLLQK